MLFCSVVRVTIRLSRWLVVTRLYLGYRTSTFCFIVTVPLSACRTRWTVTNNATSTLGDEEDNYDVVEVSEVARVADCVEECDRHQACVAVDVNETARPLVSCRFYLTLSPGRTLGTTAATGLTQFVTERCPEDGTVQCNVHPVSKNSTWKFCGNSVKS